LLVGNIIFLLKLLFLEIFFITSGLLNFWIPTLQALDIPLEKLNTCGGAVALGHPLAASGARYEDQQGFGSASISCGSGPDPGF